MARNLKELMDDEDRFLGEKNVKIKKPKKSIPINSYDKRREAIRKERVKTQLRRQKAIEDINGDDFDD